MQQPDTPPALAGCRQVSAIELARIVATLLVKPHVAGELDSAKKYSEFMTNIANVVAYACGGEILHPADAIDDESGPIWLIGVHTNDSLPDPIQNVWALSDPEGVEDIEARPGQARKAAQDANGAYLAFDVGGTTP